METTAEYITHSRTPICLGIDPGIGNTGWGVVKRLVSGYQLVASGVIRTPATAPIGERLNTYYATIRELITEHGPHLVSIESVFFNRNISSCLSTASVIAIVELASIQAGLPTLQIKPQTVKSAVTGTGTASKSSVQSFVSRLLSVDISNDHEADATAAAIAGLLKQRTPSLIS